mmetsp:Transcript_21196/g.55255  ORF Transcript_21196/g.55255 Transcript_21196/m.55255 type:complete len:233 (+) Transcript_21196:1822-2520(+)
MHREGVTRGCKPFVAPSTGVPRHAQLERQSELAIHMRGGDRERPDRVAGNRIPVLRASHRAIPAEDVPQNQVHIEAIQGRAFVVHPHQQRLGNRVHPAGRWWRCHLEGPLDRHLCVPVPILHQLPRFGVSSLLGNLDCGLLFAHDIRARPPCHQHGDGLTIAKVGCLVQARPPPARGEVQRRFDKWRFELPVWWESLVEQRDGFGEAPGACVVEHIMQRLNLFLPSQLFFNI